MACKTVTPDGCAARQSCQSGHSIQPAIYAAGAMQCSAPEGHAVSDIRAARLQPPTPPAVRQPSVSSDMSMPFQRKNVYATPNPSHTTQCPLSALQCPPSAPQCPPNAPQYPSSSPIPNAPLPKCHTHAVHDDPAVCQLKKPPQAVSGKPPIFCPRADEWPWLRSATATPLVFFRFQPFFPLSRLHLGPRQEPGLDGDGDCRYPSHHSVAPIPSHPQSQATSQLRTDTPSTNGNCNGGNDHGSKRGRTVGQIQSECLRRSLVRWDLQPIAL